MRQGQGEFAVDHFHHKARADTFQVNAVGQAKAHFAWIDQTTRLVMMPAASSFCTRFQHGVWLRPTLSA